MATTYTDLYNSQSSSTALGNGTKEAIGNVAGRVRQMFFSITPAAVTGTSDIIKLAVIPAGARVVGWKILIPSTGSTGIFALGNAVSDDAAEAADADAFGASYDAGGQAVLVQPDSTNAGLFKKFVSPVDLQLSLSEATDVGNVVINGALFYVLD